MNCPECTYEAESERDTLTIIEWHMCWACFKEKWIAEDQTLTPEAMEFGRQVAERRRNTND